MKASLSWLKDYVSIEMETTRLVEELTMAGLEVENVSERYDYLNTVYVGKIIDVYPHPNADKLKLCVVDIGFDKISVVCGAPNAKSGMLSPVALPGTLLLNGTTLKKSNIRGSVSEGMLCSELELGLGDDQSGIMSLEGNLSVGKKLPGALNISDMVLDIDLTPNRPDCLSIIGIAREIAAIQNTRLKYPDFTHTNALNDIKKYTSVVVEAPDHCPRYSARLLEDITVSPSPFWLQDRLSSVGLRPINNIVDITNFVLMEVGQPLHAFDFDLLEEKRIIVKTAKNGEKFVTLDDKERLLDSEMLMICDGKRAVAIGGVMGGLNSEINDKSKRVLIESAYFNPTSIRKTSKKLGLQTEASHRFERGIDLEGTVSALNRAAHLMAELGNGIIIEGVIDEYHKKQPVKKINLNIEKTNRLLGTHLSQSEIKSLLKSIEFNVDQKDKDSLEVEPPSFRVDIERPADVMEEVARLSGYDNIPITFPKITADTDPPLKPLRLREKIKRLMTGMGFSEAINYSFVHKDECDRLKLKPDDFKRNIIPILNPLTEDQAVMRSSLMPGLLESVRRNIDRHIRNIRLFETGKIFLNTIREDLPEEIEMLAGILTGSKHESSWIDPETPAIYYDIKGVIEGLMAGLKVEHIVFTEKSPDEAPYFQDGFTAKILYEEQLIGYVGKVHPQILSTFDIKQAVFAFELDLEQVSFFVPDSVTYKPLPKFPSIARDITIIVDKDLESRRIIENLSWAEEKLVEKIRLFDVFEGKKIPPGKKSISLRIIYRSSNKTLEDNVINDIHKDIAERLVKKFNAGLPE